jgi:hypothetical protein
MSLFDDHQFLTATRVRGVEVSTGIIAEQMEVGAGVDLIIVRMDCHFFVRLPGAPGAYGIRFRIGSFGLL